MQQVWSTINPDTTSGVMLAAILTDFKDALMSGLSGTSRPSQLTAGGMWVDTTNQLTPNYYWSFKIWTGTVDIEFFRLNINTGFGGPLNAEENFEIRQISADTVGALQALIKQRILLNGQLLNGDTVGEIQFIGRTITSTNPTVAYIKWVTTDDETTSDYGGTLSFFTTPDAGSAISEHLRLISGQVEPLVQLKINALRLVSQNISTATSVIQLSAEKCIVEFTGSTLSDIKGMNSGQESRVVTLHNRSSVIVTLKHENASAADEDKFHFPSSSDYAIEIDGTISLIYSTADERWKLYSTHDIRFENDNETITGIFSKWTAPAGATKINISTHKRKRAARVGQMDDNSSFLIDKYGKMYSWGVNTRGQLGVSDTTPRSSPVAVSGGIRFMETSEYNNDPSSYMVAIGDDGVTYAWGTNTLGSLGVGDVVARSSPVAVLGGFSFHRVYRGGTMNIGMLADGSLYAWGRNSSGGLGVGDVTNRSSPVAVLGGLTFLNLYITPSGITSAIIAMEKSGNLYSWGDNSNGVLGLNDITKRSSPIIISTLSGIKIKKFFSNGSSYALDEDGNLYGWGLNSIGQLGLGNITNKSTPTLIMASVKDFWAFSNRLVFAKTIAGIIYSWGTNSFGELAVGDTTNRSTPTLILGGFDFVDFSEVQDTASPGLGILGRTEDGVVYGWGFGGAIADSSISNRTSPVLAVGGLNLQDINLKYGALPNGTLYAWGDNTSGGLGVGNNTASY